MFQRKSNLTETRWVAPCLVATTCALMLALSASGGKRLPIPFPPGKRG